MCELPGGRLRIGDERDGLRRMRNWAVCIRSRRYGLHGLSLGQLLRDGGLERSDGGVRGGVVLGGLVFSLHGLSSGQLLCDGGPRGVDGGVRGW